MPDQPNLSFDQSEKNRIVTAIDPEDQSDRTRLRFSADYWYREQERYRQIRRESNILIAGSEEWTDNTLGLRDRLVENCPRWNNLMQQASVANAIQLAYGSPKYLAVARNNDTDSIAPRLQSFLNNYSKLINLDRIARQIANDAFVGFGISKVAPGRLPPGARATVRQDIGPMCWRISQDNFLWDGSATSWDYVSYIADMYVVPLREARNYPEFLAYNQEGTEGLQEYTFNQNRTDSNLHVNGIRNYQAQPMTRLLYMYLPFSGLEVFWPANSMTFSQMGDKPLLVRKWIGHHNGPYDILSLLDVPDNLIPVTVSDSVKNMHYLANDLLDILANQARTAKVVPVYETGSQRDADRLDSADDRKPVGVSNIQKFGQWERPGPTQSQSAYMLAITQMFKEGAGNMDDTLGLGQTAGTATQSALIRQRTNARTEESRNRMERMMSSIGEKLAHLALVDETLTMPMREAIPGVEGIHLDVSWLPPQLMPRPQNIVEYGIDVVHGSMAPRDPQARLAQLNEALTQIGMFAQLVAQGVPIELDEIVRIQSEYRDLPELTKITSGLLQQMAMQRAQAGGSEPTTATADPTKGQYTRTNVSERTGQGDLAQNLSQVPQEGNTGGGMIPSLGAM